MKFGGIVEVKVVLGELEEEWGVNNHNILYACMKFSELITISYF